MSDVQEKQCDNQLHDDCNLVARRTATARAPIRTARERRLCTWGYEKRCPTVGAWKACRIWARRSNEIQNPETEARITLRGVTSL